MNQSTGEPDIVLPPLPALPAPLPAASHTSAQMLSYAHGYAVAAILADRASHASPLSDALDALRELVACKDLKDRLDELQYKITASEWQASLEEGYKPSSEKWRALFDEYNSLRPLAWERARAVLGRKA